MPHTTPAAYALILVELAREYGAERRALLDGSSLDPADLGSLGARVADEDFRTLVENALRLTGDPALGLRLGERLNLGAHAVLGQAFLTCRNLAEVLQLFERYYHVLAPDLDLEFRQEAQRFVVVASTQDTHLPLHFGLECLAAAMRNTLVGLLGGDGMPLRYEFPYAPPGHAASYRSSLGDDVRFDRPAAAWSFGVEHLARPLPSSNPALRQLYEAECARLLSDLKDPGDLAVRSRRLLRKLEGQYPQMPQLARMLGVSPRTYRRRLADLGTSYQQLLDEVRAEHARRLLCDSKLPVASIAYRLGFSDPSNFRRAYRNWTGTTPALTRRPADGGEPPH
jgi:AraC-like DNA-binding protein